MSDASLPRLVATKRRKWLLQGDILDAAREALSEAARRHSIELIEHEGVVNHVHLLLEVDDRAALAKAMHLLKGASARSVFKRFPELKLDAHTGSFWQARYGAKAIPEEARTSVIRYIKTQWDRLEAFER